jgi:hypothetical protein
VKFNPYFRCGLTALFFAFGPNLSAQEFSFLTGEMSDPSLRQGSYAWQMDYRHGLYNSFEASVAWINEGHVVGHHRDGTAAEVWYRVPLEENSLRLSLGAGPYYFYDTEPLTNGDSRNLHGVAPLFSASAEGEIYRRWFWRVIVNRIQPTTDIATNSVVAGIGFYLGKEGQLPKGNLKNLFGESEASPFNRPNELTVYGGWSVINTLFSEGAKALALEYRRDLNRHFDWSVSYIYEGDPKIVRRSGVGIQVWPVTKYFDDRFELGFGVGTYVYIDRKHIRGTPQNHQAALAGLVAPMGTYHFGERMFTRIIWDRVITNYNRDADIWLVGFGYDL